jgi:2'-5' RNA ligase
MSIVAFNLPLQVVYAMPFAITLRLDPVNAVAIEDMWRILAEAGIDTDRRDLGYAPHVTLAIYPDDTSADSLSTVLRRVAAHWRALPVTLRGIEVFSGPSSILWAAPVVTPALLARHAEIHTALSNLAVHPHYRPQAWVPHVTLSGAVPDAAPALAVLLPRWRPVTGVLDRADLVRFRPVEVLASHALPG